MDIGDLDFDPEIKSIKPQIIHNPELREFCQEEIVNKGLTEDFRTEVNNLWADFAVSMHESQGRDEEFSLVKWVDLNTNIILEKEVREKMPLIEFKVPAIKVLAIYYVLCNINEVGPNNYVGISQEEPVLVSETTTGDLADSLNYLISLFSIYYGTYKGEVIIKEQAKDLRKRYIASDSNSYSAN